MKIYLASPFFNDNEIANIHRAAEILKAKGHEVFVPMEHDVENRESHIFHPPDSPTKFPDIL